MVVRFVMVVLCVIVGTTAAAADTGVMFNCTLTGEAPIVVYLDSTATRGALQLGNKLGPDVTTKDGSFHTKVGSRQFTFVANWQGDSKITVKGPGGPHIGICTGP
jgi:hypothetical protein